jgi:Outer membrane lipoprotein-sorting protein
LLGFEDQAEEKGTKFLRRILNLTIAILVLVTCAATTGASAAEPDAASIVKRMKLALEPARPSVRVMTLKVKSSGGFAAQWTLGQARAHVSGSDWMLTTVLKPADAKGITFLAKEKPGEAAVEYWYLPAVHLVRELTPLAGYEPFFGTDFTYQDLSFVRLGGHEKLAGTETHNGVKAYKLEEALANNPYFSKAVTWVAVDTGLPVERDFYDVDGKLFQKESFEKVSTIDKVPTIMKIVMSNVQSGGSSEIEATGVKYDKQAPVELFNPKHLANVASDSFWKTALH